MQIDGIELMSELLQNESWSHIPIIGEHAHPASSCFIWTDIFAGKGLQQPLVAGSLHQHYAMNFSS